MSTLLLNIGYGAQFSGEATGAKRRTAAGHAMAGG